MVGNYMSVRKQLRNIIQLQDNMPVRNWSFTVKHIQGVQVEEIVKYVTRNNPLAIIKYGSHAAGYIHKSIIEKAKVVDIDARFNPLHRIKKVSGYPHVQSIVLFSEEIQYLIEWCKTIKSAKWPPSEETIKIMVIIPKI